MALSTGMTDGMELSDKLIDGVLAGEGVVSLNWGRRGSSHVLRAPANCRHHCLRNVNQYRLRMHYIPAEDAEGDPCCHAARGRFPDSRWQRFDQAGNGEVSSHVQWKRGHDPDCNEGDR